MGELHRQLGFGNAVESRRGRDLPDGGGVTAFERAGQLLQITRPAREQRVAGKDQARAGVGQRIKWKRLKQLLGRGQLFNVDGRGAGVLIYDVDRRRRAVADGDAADVAGVDRALSGRLQWTSLGHKILVGIH